MRFTTSVEGILPTMLNGFFEGWPNPPSGDKHLELLHQSYKCVLAIDDSDKVVGFITAISDGVLSAYIPLLEVLPSYRNQGIGRQLINRMLEELNDFYMVDLICDEDLQRYYEKCGFSRAVGMIIRNYSFQSGR